MRSKKVLFSIHKGHSIAHVLRTREMAKDLYQLGHNVLYSISSDGYDLIKGYLPRKFIFFNDQKYSFDCIPFKGDISTLFYTHAKSEKILYAEFKPDCIIADTGAVVHAYCPREPFAKIIDRFYCEIGLEIESAFSPIEKAIITSQAELLINATRKRLGLKANFLYDDFLKPPIFVDGSLTLLQDIDSEKYFLVGPNFSLKMPTNHSPQVNTCLVTLGTGISNQVIGDINKLLSLLEKFFRKVYVSAGFKIDIDKIYHSNKINTRPVFNELPPNIGVVVTHCGTGSMHLAISLDVPIIGIPMHIEQYSNAYNMEKHGYGINVGLINRGMKFKGIYERPLINWSLLKNSLMNIHNIRRTKCPVGFLSISTLKDKALKFIEDI
jgi:UDP:flavonoid glycosyltransferase YjiC (YdhE family)